MTESQQPKFVLVSAAGVVALLIALGGIFLAVKNQQTQTNRIEHEQQVRQYQQCLTANDSRQAIRSAFDVLIKAASENPDPNRTPEEVARADQTIAKFTNDLAAALPIRECGKKVA